MASPLGSLADSVWLELTFTGTVNGASLPALFFPPLPSNMRLTSPLSVQYAYTISLPVVMKTDSFLAAAVPRSDVQYSNALPAI
jgi:hypothetical protein